MNKLHQSRAPAFGDTVRHLLQKRRKSYKKKLPVKVPQPDTNS